MRNTSRVFRLCKCTNMATRVVILSHRPQIVRSVHGCRLQYYRGYIHTTKTSYIKSIGCLSFRFFLWNIHITRLYDRSIIMLTRWSECTLSLCTHCISLVKQRYLSGGSKINTYNVLVVYTYVPIIQPAISGDSDEL